MNDSRRGAKVKTWNIVDCHMADASMLLPARGVTLTQFGGHLLDAHALAGEQHDEMVEHVRAFVDKAFGRAIGGFDDKFQSLLAHLLGHAVETVAEKACGVRAFGHLAVALLDEVLQLREEQQRIAIVGLAPAGVGARVANRSFGVDAD